MPVFLEPEENHEGRSFQEITVLRADRARDGTGGFTRDWGEVAWYKGRVCRARTTPFRPDQAPGARVERGDRVLILPHPNADLQVGDRVAVAGQTETYQVLGPPVFYPRSTQADLSVWTAADGRDE